MMTAAAFEGTKMTTKGGGAFKTARYDSNETLDFNLVVVIAIFTQDTLTPVVVRLAGNAEHLAIGGQSTQVRSLVA